jgi:hypothetical protein
MVFHGSFLSFLVEFKTATVEKKTQFSERERLIFDLEDREMGEKGS